MLLPPSRAKATSCNPRNMIPNPASLIKGKQELPEVDQLETISLETLNQYHCDNPDRRLVSLFGTVYDVTSSENSYGSDGAYKEYAGHDVTLALSMHKTQEEWLDRFVQMKQKWKDDAKGWADYFGAKYPVCGRLDKWDEEISEWPELTSEEIESLEKGCTIM
jgi:predicted heme/steroid binding protein